MKGKLLILLFFCVSAAFVFSQARVILPDSSQITTDPDSMKLLPRQAPPGLERGQEEPFDTINLELPSATVWHLHPRSGDRIVVPMDTLKHNFQQTTVPR